MSIEERAAEKFPAPTINDEGNHNISQRYAIIDLQRSAYIQGYNEAKEMKWIDVNDENIIDEEVIALGYQNEMLIGYINKVRFEYECESDSAILDKVTHYLPLTALPTPPQAK